MPQNNDTANAGRVIYNARQVEVMETCSQVLLRYFAGVENGRAIYDDKGCATPTMAEAKAAAEMLAVAVGCPVPPEGFRAHALTKADQRQPEQRA